MINIIKMWHERARPNPDANAFNVQLGCHVEEFVEMLASLYADDLGTAQHMTNLKESLSRFADALKDGTYSVGIVDRKEFLDALADQIVTSTGVGHCANMHITEAVQRVNKSNWSKYTTDGYPVFDKNGKIMKGVRYEPPNLDGLY